MKECSVKAGRGIIGEILVFEKLISQHEKSLLKDGNHIEFLGSSIKGHDIEMRIDGHLFKINAKGTTENDKAGFPRWVRQHARNYVNIFVKKGKAQIEVKEQYDQDLYYVFVDIRKWLTIDIANFYVLSDKEAKRLFGNKYRKAFDNKNVRKNNSDDMWVEYIDIKDHENNSLSLLSKT